ncbi:putative ribonuclease VapC19 [Mycobacterium kansasii 732]|uniref:type II toxin-antitoxin system VapC family toxin n=1 Tax=Mycobacterium pseudokansasii TaxID=2341080 RepID=UPI00045323FE|nr:type II toxin-antitoxin system VapC family toxin [Mycobacterium pseudokansasii]EUA10839.1 putative ribonuclease VapC19 [Mycobacterium kansasii 732]KZS65652.1 ribonuclease [Mycobacterium kansasii]MBY0390075.1 type II toxin-antitoxin system VapC family toxin [Mycobacterium pseudokansasii]
MILVDSDVLIAHLRGVAVARDWLLNVRSRGPLTMSVVSIAELIGGMRTVERREVWRLLASFRVEPVTEIIARRAGDMMRRYRRSHNGIGLGDYLIGATADVRGLELATLNVRHFPMFEHLQPPFAITDGQPPGE